MFFELLLFFALPAEAQDLHVLMVGNSYTTHNELQDMLADLLEVGVPGWSYVYARRVTTGGYPLSEHAADADGSRGDTSLRGALVTGVLAGEWDWVFLQDQPEIPGFDFEDSRWIACRDGVEVLDGLIQDGGAETILWATWGLFDGDDLYPDIFPDYPSMQSRLMDGYLAYVDAVSTPERPVWLAPVGLARERIYNDLLALGVDPLDDGTLFSSLYVTDGSHPTEEGTYLTACNIFVTMTGRSAVGLPLAVGVDENLGLAIQQAATNTVFDDLFGDVAYRWMFSWSDWTEDIEVPTSVSIAGDVTMPLVWTDGSISITDAHVGSGGDGRLLIPSGTSFQVSDSLTVGADGHGELWLDGGAAVLPSLELASEAGSEALVRVRSGELDVGSIELGEGSAEMSIEGGTLTIGSGSLPAVNQTGGVLQPGATLSVDGDYTLASDGTLVVDLSLGAEVFLSMIGAAILTGTIELSEGEETCERTILTASTINATGLTVSDGYSFEVRSVGDNQELLVSFGTSTYYADADADTFGDAHSSVTTCMLLEGYVSDNTDCDDSRANVYPGALEVCDSIDDDCDGRTDEVPLTGAPTWYRDIDGDGYGNSSRPYYYCTMPAGYAAEGGDCADGNPARNPGAAETCDGVDQDCDGRTDEVPLTGAPTWYRDIDGDGYGNSSRPYSYCTMPAGYAAGAGDCADGDPARNPGAAETCDGVDQDCDRAIDEGAGTTWYRDLDGDGWGNTSRSVLHCTEPTGYLATPGDCADSNAARYPGATETCNSLDDDCDGTVDEDGACEG